jgi:3,4-dihydroxy-2-butanone 4-phosphate synthase
MSEERIRKAIEAFQKGEFVILVDDEDRENEGDLTIAAEKVTPEAINFMAKYGRGLICLAITEEKADELDLPLMVNDNTSRFSTAFTISIDAKEGTSTGISASDRAITILKAVDDNAKPEDFSKPGHVFPLRAKKGGVLVRTGQTEGSVDLARIAGLFAGRGYNIESLTVAPIPNSKYSHFTIETEGSQRMLEQIIKQLNKLIPVLKVTEHCNDTVVEKEMALVKIPLTESLSDVDALSRAYNGLIVNSGENEIIVMVADEPKRVNNFIKVIKKFNPKEIVTSGVVAVERS